MSHRKGRNNRKGFARRNKDLLYFFYFCGTKILFRGKASRMVNKSPTEMTEMTERLRSAEQRFPFFFLFPWDNKYYPHGIIMSHRKSRNGRKGFASGG